MSENVAVSVIIPVYNAENYIEAAVNSVLTQTFSNFEIICVDDGSTDDTGKILDAMSQKDSRLAVFHCANGGPAKARNFGINHANGTWIQFMDSDDLIDRNMLAEMNSLSEGCDMVVSGAIRENLQTGEKVTRCIKSRRLDTREEIGHFMTAFSLEEKDLFLNYLWNRWIRKDIIADNSVCFNEDIILGEDFLFNCEIVKHCNKINITDKAYYHYISRSGGSLVGRFDVHESERRNIMHREICSLMEDFCIGDETQDFIRKNEGRYCLNSMNKINYPTCSLNEAEKIEYLGDFMTPERKMFFLKYWGSRDLIEKIKLTRHILAFSLGSPKLMYFFINKKPQICRQGASEGKGVS